VRPFLLIAAIVAAAIPWLAQAQEAVMLEPGDAISLRVGTDGTMSASPREQAQWTEFDLAAARHLAAIPIPVAR
jgi:hypothetical protein